jgi:SNF2 family DNA or RNA helicase
VTTATPVRKARKSLEPWLYDSVEFYPHQVDGIRWLLRKRSFLLADDMGLGKSLQALTIFCADVKEGLGEVLFVICPVSLRVNWADEIEKFTSLPYVLLGEEINPLNGRSRNLSVEERRLQILDFALASGPRVMIMNYEQVKPHLPELNAVNAWAAVFDEAHTIKGATSQRTVASLELKAYRNMLLTGTPILNQVNEIWPILNKIAPNHFPNYSAFVNRYCVYGGYKGKSITGVKNQKQLHNILNEIMLRRLKSETLDLPEVLIIPINVDLSFTQRQLYDRLVEEEKLENVDPNGPDEEIENALTRFLRLKQICGTPATLGFGDDSIKLDEVVRRAAEILANGQKLIVFTQFRGVLECLRSRFIAEGLPVIELHGGTPKAHRQEVVNRWTHYPDPAIILCMTQVAGVGLNMTAARTIFFVDKLFVPGLNDQAISRAHRIGQDTTQPVTVYEFIARGTIEHRIEQILKLKVKLFKNVIEGVGVVRKILQALRE